MVKILLDATIATVIITSCFIEGIVANSVANPCVRADVRLHVGFRLMKRQFILRNAHWSKVYKLSKKRLFKP